MRAWAIKARSAQIEDTGMSPHVRATSASNGHATFLQLQNLIVVVDLRRPAVHLIVRLRVLRHATYSLYSVDRAREYLSKVGL